MAIRQYIGARYVPRFLGAYDPTQIYDALDVVDNGSGTSYIARKTVPAGTPLTDTEYWFIYGATSGAILQLQNDMNQAQNDIITLYDEKETSLKDRTFLFMSDSYHVQIEYLDFVAQFIQCHAHIIKAYTGAGFYKHNSLYDNYTFKNILQTIDPLTTAEKEAITDVAFCVACGNDNTGVDSDLTNAMADIDSYLRSELPNLKAIRLYPVGWASNDAALQAQIERNIDIYMRMSAYLCWKYADCTRVLRSGVYFNTTDAMGYHPATNARYQLAYAVAGAIISGSCQYTWNEELTATFNASIDTAQWGANAVISTPADGILKSYVKIGNDGSITFNQTDFPIKLEHVNIAQFNSYYDIILTPTQANRNPIPIGGRYQLAGYGNNFVVQNVMLMRQSASVTKIRVFTYAAAATTGSTVWLWTPSVKLFPI